MNKNKEIYSVIPGARASAAQNFFADIQVKIQALILHQVQALQSIAENLPKELSDLAYMICMSHGKLFFSGIGKSGHIARKVAATFSSTGTAAFFVHPAEALHGDAGMLGNGDILIAVSKSGISEEFSVLLPLLRRRGVFLVLLTGVTTQLARLVDLVILLAFPPEAGSVPQVPTTSSIISLALCDALALVVGEYKGFSLSDFAQVHPGGLIGDILNLKVRDIMHDAEHLPFVFTHDVFAHVMGVITEKKLGVGIVVDAMYALRGIITDGDVRRACAQGPRIFDCVAENFMTHHPKTIVGDAYAHAAAKIMTMQGITSLVVVEDQKVVGLLHMHDLLARGILG